MPKLRLRNKGVGAVVLKAWRERMGWSRYRAAREMWVSVTTYRRWEEGEQDPPGMIEVAMRWFEAFGGSELPRKSVERGTGGSIGQKGVLVSDVNNRSREMDGLDRAQADAYERKQAEWDAAHAEKNVQAAEQLEHDLGERVVGPVAPVVVAPVRNVETWGRTPVPKPVAKGEDGADRKPSGEETQEAPSYEDASQEPSGGDSVNQEYRRGGRPGRATRPIRAKKGGA